MLDRDPSEEALSDAQIVSLLVSDDGQRGCEALVQQHFPRTRAVLRRHYRAAQPEEIEEVLAAALTKIWHRAREFDPARGALAAWYFAIARNELVATMRMRIARGVIATLGSAELDALSRQPAVEQSARQTKLLQALAACVDALARLQREVVLADLEHGASVAGNLLAERLGSTPNAIFAARCKARARLRRCLDEKGFR